MVRTAAALAALLLTLITHAQTPPSAHEVTPEWTESYLKATHSALLDDSVNDHVMSYYYFGSVGHHTLMGLERVRGDDYDQYFSLMIFSGKTLLGYYRDVASFPSGVSATGDVSFPRGVGVQLQGSAAPFNILAESHLPLCLTVGAQTRCVDWVAVTADSSPAH